MPFKSEAQRKFMFKNKPAMAKEWEAATPAGAKLPERVGKKKAGGAVAPPSRFTPNKRFGK